MLARFECVVFDWDGTLVDSTATIARSIQASAADLGLPVPNFALASQVIGLGLHDVLARAVPGLPTERAADFSERYRYHYLAAEDTLELFDGVRDLLHALRVRGATLAVATGKTSAGLARAMASTGLAPYFAATRCADQTQPKPHPAMLLELSEELRIDARRMLMIGDTTHDLLMASAAKVEAVGVTFGAHSRGQLAGLAPLALFDSIADLHQWLMPR